MSHVAMEKKQCQVCGVVHGHNCGVLLHKQLKNTKTNSGNDVVTGLGYCEEHQRLSDDNFVALVECTNEGCNETLNMDTAERTGNIVHMKRHVFSSTFDTELSAEQDLVFIDSEVFTALQNMKLETVH